MKRITMAGFPHHVIQRGLQGRDTFFIENDYVTYLRIMTECSRQYEVEILAYCLMPDHVHLIAVPQKKNALSGCLRTAHGRYTRYINRRCGNSGQFWQGRYASHLLDDDYLIACARYIEINPVKRDYVNQPEEWLWSSAQAHIFKKEDSLVQGNSLPGRVKTDWQDFLAEERPEEEADLFYLHEKNGHPLGSDVFLSMIEKHMT